MIITSYGIIVFHLAIWIGVFQLSERVRYIRDVSGLAYPAIVSRHDVPGKTFPTKIYYDQEPIKLQK